MRKVATSVIIAAIAAISAPAVVGAEIIVTPDTQESVSIDERAAASKQPVLKVIGSTMEFRSADGSPVTFEIFSITGQLIKKVTAKATTTKVELPKGFYIVKCDSWTRRVMLK